MIFVCHYVIADEIATEIVQKAALHHLDHALNFAKQKVVISKEIQQDKVLNKI